MRKKKKACKMFSEVIGSLLTSAKNYDTFTIFAYDYVDNIGRSHLTEICDRITSFMF